VQNARDCWKRDDKSAVMPYNRTAHSPLKKGTFCQGSAAGIARQQGR